MKKYTISVDFDGTIVDHAFPNIGELKSGVKEALEELSKYFEIVISSCRSSKMFEDDKKPLNEMIQFLKNNEIPYDRIDMGDEGKVVAIAYIDDRAIHFNNNWEEIAKKLIGENK